MKKTQLHPRAAELISSLDLEPHPEGGYFTRHFCSTSFVRPTDGRPDRPALTSIYFLLPGGACSRWHRVLSDEAWHLYEGDPLELYWAGDGDNFSDVTARLLGPIQTDGAAMRPVGVVPRNRWQAARSTGSYSLVGCSVGPGFDFADFELLTQRPDLVERLTNARPDLARFL